MKNKLKEPKEIRKIKQDKIIWKPEKRTVPVPYCPVCKKELFDYGKDHKPYGCDCGDWFWDEENEGYGIFK